MQTNEKYVSETLDIKYYVRIGGTLLIITALIAVLLAVVNGMTADKIADNNIKAKADAISSIFGGCDENIPEIDIAFEEPVKTVYEVLRDGNQIGYCIYVSPAGFKDAIDMMVGTTADGTIVGVDIVSHSETPGLGSHIDDADYLADFSGLSGQLVLRQDIDAIAGATISSSAVVSGVNAALAIEGLFAEKAADGGSGQ